MEEKFVHDRSPLTLSILDQEGQAVAEESLLEYKDLTHVMEAYRVFGL